MSESLEAVRAQVLELRARDGAGVREAFWAARLACGIDDDLADLMIARGVEAGDDLQALVLKRTIEVYEARALQASTLPADILQPSMASYHEAAAKAQLQMYGVQVDD